MIKRKKPLAKVSAKQQGRNARYSKVRNHYLATHTVCMIKQPGCSFNSTQVHHTEGRSGELLFDTTYFLPSCTGCHVWAEEHPDEAKQLGFTKNRLT